MPDQHKCHCVLQAEKPAPHPVSTAHRHDAMTNGNMGLTANNNTGSASRMLAASASLDSSGGVCGLDIM